MKPYESMLPVQAGLLRPEPRLLLLSPGKDVSSSWHIPILLPIMMLQKIEMLQ